MEIRASRELIAFDLDGTLTESKSPMDKEMGEILEQLLERYKVAVISGGRMPQFEAQFLNHFNCKEELLSKLYLLPTSGSQFYHYEDGLWKKIYSEELTAEEKDQIMDAFSKTFEEMSFEHPETTYGPQFQDRESQISFSANGQNTPLEIKKAYDPDQKKRKAMKEVLDKYIPHFMVTVGGTNTIDVTREGVDKAYGMKKLAEHLGLSFAQMQFVGDRLEEGGNDYPVKAAGIDSIAVTGPEETKAFLRDLLAS